MPYISLCIYRVEYDLSKVDHVQDLREAYFIGGDPEDITIDLRQDQKIPVDREG